MTEFLRGLAGWLRPFHWKFAAFGGFCAPLLLAFGGLVADPLHVAIAVGAAFSVGFGASRELAGWRWGAMAAAALGMALAGFSGTLAGAMFGLLVAASAVLAALCAVLALKDEDWWWISLQIAIAFLVAGYFPGDFAVAEGRFFAILAGGAAQICCVSGAAAVTRAAFARLPRPPKTAALDRRLAFAHGGRAAFAVGGSLALAAAIGLQNDYWAPVTALIVLKPGLNDTRARGFLRAGGTIGGCAVAMVLAFVLRDDPVGLGVGASLALIAAYGLQKAHYAVFTAAVTIFVVLITSFGRGGALVASENRLVDTMLGCALAIAAAALFPHRPPEPPGSKDCLGEAQPGSSR